MKKKQRYSLQLFKDQQNCVETVTLSHDLLRVSGELCQLMNNVLYSDLFEYRSSQDLNRQILPKFDGKRFHIITGEDS